MSEETSGGFLEDYAGDSAMHRAKCILKIGHLVRELAGTIELDVWFAALRGDLGDVQAYFEEQYAEPSAA